MVSRALVLGFVVALVCFTGLVGVTSGFAATDSAVDTPRPATGSGGFETSTANGFARTTFTFTVYRNGSIRWTTTYAKSLRNDSDVSEFRSFATEFNTTETQLYRDFVSQAEILSQRANERTNRTTRARNFQKRAYVDEGGFSLGTQGKVEMSFLWTNLSRMAGDRVVLGDVFEQGLYLGSSVTLVVEPGPEMAFAATDPEPDSMAVPSSLQESDSITWNGERQFADQRPRVGLVPAQSLQTTTPSPSTTAVTTPTSPALTTASPGTTTAGAAGSGVGGDGTMLVVAVIVLLLGAGTAVVYRTMTTTDDDEPPAPAPQTTSSPASSPPSATAETTPSGPDDPETEAADPAEPAVSDEELLSDTDRVQSILHENGGRMRQSAIVEETEWSKSKVSMLLSDMEDEDAITKLRVGRENIISLPGHEPDAAGSPFEDRE